MPESFFINELLGSSGNSPEFLQFAMKWGYLGIFFYFVSLDQVTPIPEEVSLLTIGYLSANDVFNPFIAGAISLAGFLTVDSAYYLLSKSGSRLARRIYDRNLWVKKYADKLRENMGKSIIILCFIPRMRMFGPILVGMLNLSFKKFFLFDAIALSLFTSVFLGLGFIFHQSLDHFLGDKKVINHIIFACVAVIAAFFAIRFVIMRRREREKDQ